MRATGQRSSTTEAPATYRLVCSACVVLLALLASVSARSQTVIKLSLHDEVQPVTAAYLQRGLRSAAEQHAAAVLLSLGTPGGLMSSTREMVGAIERSPVPVIVYVEPQGARAGSAGFFLLEAADVAVMAPGTNAGAAHPIVQGVTMDPVLKQKIEEDAGAFLRSITAPRHRDTPAATAAVLQARAYSADEALQNHLIDSIEPNETTLLQHLDGRDIARFDGSTQTLHLAHSTVQLLAPSLRERLLTYAAKPDVAVLLLVVGLLLLYLEFNVPGAVIPGALGILCLALALFGFQLLPIHHAAILLLLLALVLIILELKFTTHGVLALAGSALLVLGLLTLVDGPPELRVHASTAFAAGLALGGITFTLAMIALRARRNKALTGPEAMLGLVATASTPLAPAGQVSVRGELWQALLEPSGAVAAAGERLVVRAVQGLTLHVARLDLTVPNPVPRTSKGLD